jgi:integrase/recombinase XerD
MPEYNPVNEVIKKQYEETLIHGKCRDGKTVKAVWDDITLFEKYTGRADFKSFNIDHAKGFKKWLEKQTNKDGNFLSLSTMRATLRHVREFFLWLRLHPKYGRKVNATAIEYLNLSNNESRASRASKDKTPPTIEELEQALNAMPFESDIEKRDRAIFAFMILTCVRDDALISLKIKDFYKKTKTVWQDPKHVRTKRRKGITTALVTAPIPEAEMIFLEWYSYAIDIIGLKPNDPLFPKTKTITNPKTLSFEIAGVSNEHWASTQPIRDMFKVAFQRVGLPYFNPHLFRKTIVIWAEKNCTPYEFKAISQNLGHDNAMTTYNAYGNLTERAQIEAILSLGKGNKDLIDIPDEDLVAELSRRVIR